jgi:hypothetical protein
MNKKRLLLLLFTFLVFVASNVFAQSEKDSTKLLKIMKSYIDISGQYFLSNQYTVDFDDSKLDAFTLKRGYVTYKKRLNETFSMRFTQDITLDKEGSDAGNVELRLKYCYLKVKNDYFKPLKNTYFELGLVHRPWVDFEQKINDYRVQGKMYMERTKMISSADFGVLFVGLLGGKLESKYLEGINSSYPGKWGSVSFGVFNGGGYHATEQNNNKTIEARLTLRPFPYKIPGLQFTYNYTQGKGNVVESPDFYYHHGFLSYENKYTVLTAQAFQGKGNDAGTYVDTLFNSYNVNGYSFFGEFKIPRTKVAVFARYDNYCLMNADKDVSFDVVGGVAYRFLGRNKFIIDVDYTKRPDGKECYIYEAAIEIVF